jgi:predicted GNAT family acetyltransferase
VRVERLSDAGEFLETSAVLRSGEPVLCNLVGSIATSVQAGRHYEETYWWVVRDDASQVVGAALRTAPYRLVVSPMPLEAASALGTAVAAADPGVPGCNGPQEVVRAVLAALGAPGGHRGYRVTMTDAVYVLGDYAPPRPVAGAARRAVQEDLDRLVRWHIQFTKDAGLPSHDVEASVADRLAHAGLWLWEVDDEPVAMGGHAALVDSVQPVVGRIGPIYTPAALRGRGYGSAVTAAVVDDLLPRCDVVMLYADAANPASNSIYQALGFVAVGEVVETEILTV